LVAAEHRMRLQQIASRVAEEYGLDTDVLLAEYGPGGAPTGPDEADGSSEARGADEARGANGVGEHNGIRQHEGICGANGTAEDNGTHWHRGVFRANGTGGINGTGGGQGTLPVFNRAETERRARVAERQLAQLGKVNPLALEEFEALQERHA